MLARIDQLQRQADLQPAAFDALDENYKTALNMITAPETKGAFDLAKEDAKLRDAYGQQQVRPKLPAGPPADRSRRPVRHRHRRRLGHAPEQLQEPERPPDAAASIRACRSC